MHAKQANEVACVSEVKRNGAFILISRDEMVANLGDEEIDAVNAAVFPANSCRWQTVLSMIRIAHSLETHDNGSEPVGLLSTSIMTISAE